MLAISHSKTYSSPNSDSIPIKVIAAEEVVAYVNSLFKHDLIKSLASTPDNPIYDLIQELAKFPLFVFTPPKDPAARLNFTSYFRLLSLRRGMYADPIMGDLYLLHEMQHIATMPYNRDLDYKSWREKMIFNEKETTFFGEILIHFKYPEIRKAFEIKEIWVDRFLQEKERLDPSMSNADLWKNDPKRLEELLFARYLSIGSQPYSALDDQERRTWVFDRANHVFSQSYWNVAPQIEGKMQDFYALAKTDPDNAISNHLEWLNDNWDGVLLYGEPARTYYETKKQFVNLREHTGIANFCAECGLAQKYVERLVEEDKVEGGRFLPLALDLLATGITTTVYALPYPETEKLTTQFWLNEDLFNTLFAAAYTRRQDQAHVPFVTAYLSWSAEVVKGLNDFEYAYISNGSSEAIKDTVAQIAKKRASTLELQIQALQEGKELPPLPRIHVFEGEYEGISAYASAHGVELVKHPRGKETILKLPTLTNQGDYFYISQPSAIDGNLWTDYDLFMQKSKSADIKVLVDLAYVGVVANPYHIDVSHSHIESVFYSLSKSFGAYYQRIGGVFTRKENPLLFGNKWFKNLASLGVGTLLLNNHDVYDLPRKHRWAQDAVINESNAKWGTTLQPSDVVLLAHQAASLDEVPDELRTVYRRNNKEEGTLRPCLTPGMDILINETTHKTVCEEMLAVIPDSK